MNALNRRNFLKASTVAFAGGSLAGSAGCATRPAVEPHVPSMNPLPRWRGFNLMAFFSSFSNSEQYRNMSVSREDLEWIRDWGFDYIRLPFSYWLFVDGSWKQTGNMDPADIRKLDENAP